MPNGFQLYQNRNVAYKNSQPPAEHLIRVFESIKNDRYCTSLLYLKTFLESKISLYDSLTCENTQLYEQICVIDGTDFVL